MKLDAATLRAEAEAHRARMQSPLWSEDSGQRDDRWTAKLNPERRSAVPPPDPAPLQEHPEPTETTEWDSLLSTEGETNHPSRSTRASTPNDAREDLLPRLDSLDRAVEKLTAAMSRRPLGGGDASGWLEAAVGNPHTYDAPDADRKGVCVRVLPTSYAQLQQLQRKMGLRTTAGTWEFLLRLGFAAVGKLPV